MLNFQGLFLNKCLETKITAKKTTSPVNQGIFLGRTWKWKPKERYVDSLKWHHDLQVVYQMWFFRLHRNTGDLRVIFPKNLSFGVENPTKLIDIRWKDFLGHTVDGQNPAPPRMMIIPLSIGFYTSQVVQDFWTIKSTSLQNEACEKPQAIDVLFQMIFPENFSFRDDFRLSGSDAVGVFWWGGNTRRGLVVQKGERKSSSRYHFWGGGLRHFWEFSSRIPGEMIPNWRAYFSNGLKLPTSIGYPLK